MSAVIKPDDIGYWSEIKLDILREYASAYSTILSSRRDPRLSHFYIDGCSGGGVHISRETGALVEGSPLVALNVSPPFKHFFFVDLNSQKIAQLRQLAGSRSDVEIFEGDCNEVLLERVLPRVRYSAFERALCVLDPYGMHLDWRVIEAAGRSRTIEIFLNFPVMDANMNALWRSKNPDAPGADRMTAIWGDRSWLEVAYEADPQGSLFGPAEPIKVDNDAIAEAFRQRLRDVAGFAFVPPPIPMRNSNSAIVYYLYFASQNSTGEKIVRQVFDKYRDRRG